MENKMEHKTVQEIIETSQDPEFVRYVRNIDDVFWKWWYEQGVHVRVMDTKETARQGFLAGFNTRDISAELDSNSINEAVAESLARYGFTHLFLFAVFNTVFLSVIGVILYFLLR